MVAPLGGPYAILLTVGSNEPEVGAPARERLYQGDERLA